MMPSAWHVFSVNSLAPGKFEWNFGYVIFKWILVIDGWGICCEIALIWMSLDFTDDTHSVSVNAAFIYKTYSHGGWGPYGAVKNINIIPQHFSTFPTYGMTFSLCINILYNMPLTYGVNGLKWGKH